ncbi:MAG: hypothetical protein U1E93_09605 [Alphaproteobacteria bacterium]
MPSGAWRWAALGFVLLALGAAGLTLAAPQVAGLAGYALLIGIALVAVLFLFAVWPRSGRHTQDALRIAEAAGKANIAWAITGEDGAVLDCNPVYRRMAGVGEMESPPPPELALSGEPSAAVLYRLSRDAAEGARARKALWWCPALRSSPPCACCRTSRPPGGSPRALQLRPRRSRFSRALPPLSPRLLWLHPSPQRRPLLPHPSRISVICSATRPWARPSRMPRA